MKANELMIGDWVKLSKGNWFENRQVGLIDIEMIAESVYLAEPIPLTAEILEKNFPKKENEADYVKERMEVGFSVNWFPLSDLNGVFFIILDMPYKLETARIEHLHKGTFRYVHELQHLLWICGIEKEIEL